jgi:hypothetical protein
MEASGKIEFINQEELMELKADLEKNKSDLYKAIGILKVLKKK